MQKQLPVAELMTRFGRKERELKNAGAYAEAAGVRDAMVLMLRMADEDDEPIDPSEGDES